MRKAFSADTLKDFFRYNVGLSDAIYQAGGSRTLKRLLGTISSQALRYRYMAYRHAPEMKQVSIEANSEIIKAIALQRPRDARRLTDAVIQRSWKRVRDIVARLADEAKEPGLP